MKKENSENTFSCILHPTDFTPTSERAFAHALKIALIQKGSFFILHADAPGKYSTLSDFPKVREFLCRWQILPPQASLEKLFQLGMEVEKIRISEKEPLQAILLLTESKKPDLVVIATHCRTWTSRILHPSIAESTARQSGKPTLFIPEGAPGFVSVDDGKLTLHRILVPVYHTPDPQVTVDATAAFLRSCQCKKAHVRLLYVGKKEDRPLLSLPKEEAWRWEEVAEEGKVVDSILAIADHWLPHLIVMGTQGHDSIADALVGSTIERVLHRASCPILAIPQN